jgi:hypothetical protein
MYPAVPFHISSSIRRKYDISTNGISFQQISQTRDHSAPSDGTRSQSPGGAGDYGQNGFLRSASARLPRHKQPRDQEMQSAASAIYLDDGGDGTGGGGTDGSKSIDRKKLQQVCEHSKYSFLDTQLETPSYRKSL